MGIVSRLPASSGKPFVIGEPGLSALRELPMVLAATASVTVLPALLAARILPARDALAIFASAVVAMALAAITTRLGAAAWSRKPGADDVLFADLMLWSWLRTRWHEHRLIAAQRRLAALDAETTGMPLGALTRMGRLLESRDMYTYGHSRRVARHAETIARAMHLDPAAVEQVRRAALVHDIGKIYTPREILDKPDRLTDAEFDIIKRHPDDGAGLLSHLGEPEVVEIVRHHHERLDGGGYPNGLSGAAIPLGARIIAVADTFDALTSTRAYRRSTSHKQALSILAAEAGTQLDSDAVAAFLRHYSASRPAALVAALTSGGERLLGALGGATAGLGSGAGAVGAAAAAAAVLALGPALEPISSHAIAVRATTQPVAAALPVLPSARSRNAQRTTSSAPSHGRRSPATERDHAPARRPSPRPAASTSATAASPATSHAAPTADTPAADPSHTPAATASSPQVSTPVAAVGPVRLPAAPAASSPADVKLPAVTTPAVTVPAITTPVASAPAVTVPTVTIDLPALHLPVPPR
jgi:putative nucleotidyltransferase with HDIG domain